MSTLYGGNIHNALQKGRHLQLRSYRCRDHGQTCLFVLKAMNVLRERLLNSLSVRGSNCLCLDSMHASVVSCKQASYLLSMSLLCMSV